MRYIEHTAIKLSIDNLINTVNILIIIVFLFSVVLVVVVWKGYKLKKENDRLEALNNSFEEDIHNNETDKPYRDFTDGHLYDNRK